MASPVLWSQLNRLISAGDYRRAHPQLERLQALLYHDVEHSQRVTELAFALAKRRGLSDADALFVAQVAMLHDWDPSRTVGTPPQVAETLKLLEGDWNGVRSLVGGGTVSILKTRFGWSELQYRQALAMIQRTDFPYEGRAVEAFARRLSEIKGDRQRAFALVEGAILSEYADKASWYVGSYRKAKRAVCGLANEINALSREPKSLGACIVDLAPQRFMREIGQAANFAGDHRLAAELRLTALVAQMLARQGLSSLADRQRILSPLQRLRLWGNAWRVGRWVRRNAGRTAR